MVAPIKDTGYPKNGFLPRMAKDVSLIFKIVYCIMYSNLALIK